MLANLKNILIGVFSAVIVVAIGASAYSALASSGSGETAAPASAPESGNGRGNGNAGSDLTDYRNGTGTSVLDLPASELNAEETAALLYMREEEKLARDVYNALYALWEQPTFSNIAASEGAHMAEVLVLLDRYALADPALTPGAFSDPNLQALYDQLVAQGSVSLAEALKVGAAVEEIDILDLQARIAQTDNADIQSVFNNLMMGSYNHLNAFTGALLSQTGETYQPLYLSAEAYAAITSAGSGNGNANGGNGNANGGNGNANGGNGNANGGAAAGGYRGGQDSAGAGGNTNAPQPQANLTGASTINGAVSAYDGVTLTVATTEGQSVVVQLGNAQYAQSIGFYPQIGSSVSVNGFPGDQGLFSAMNVTLNGQSFAFRDELGRPLWAGGRSNGRGGDH